VERGDKKPGARKDGLKLEQVTRVAMRDNRRFTHGEGEKGVRALIRTDDG